MTSDPPGRRVVVDNSSYTAPYSFEWTPGSTHSLRVASPQTSEPARYIFDSWDNGETETRTVTAPSESATYTARFSTQYLLTTSSAPSYGGSLTVHPSSNDDYYDRGALVEFSATPNTGYRVDYWSGDLGGHGSPLSLVIDDQKVVTARFAVETGPSMAAVSAASYASGGVAPGEIVTIFGNNLGPETPVMLQLDGSGKVRTELAGTRILFDGVAAPLVAVQARQSSAVVPYSVAGRPSTVMRVERQGPQS
ncbi:MAG: hypothetical protein EHM65_11715, partial [Acidobacteriales bacterium]